MLRVEKNGLVSGYPLLTMSDKRPENLRAELACFREEQTRLGKSAALASGVSTGITPMQVIVSLALSNVNSRIAFS